MSELVFEARGIVKNFPGVRALDGANLQLKKGEVHALVGENGAGKSTLMHILGGVIQPDAGQILVQGKPTKLSSPHHASRQGIGIVFQELSLAPNLSVAENIFAHRQPVKALDLIDWPRLHECTRGLLDLFDLDVDPRTPVKLLSVAEQQVVEILKAISQAPSVLILDEPTSSLTTRETTLLFRNIRRLKAEGMAFIYISHHLPEVFEISDRVTVLRDGANVATAEAAAMDEARLVRMMVGRELINMYGSRDSEIGEKYFTVEQASRSHSFRDISFSLRRGEILGFAGLVGAGRTELARGIFGVEPLDSGLITLDGEPLKIRNTRAAIRQGIGYLTEDRKDQGLFLRMQIRENCVAPSLESFTDPLGFLREQRITQFAETSRARFNIITPGIHQQVRNLSGGNQQKVLLSMWMGIRPRLLIVDEPTRGIDVGARSEIYGLLRALAATGVGIILVSSDLLEILGLSDRIIVMREGQIVGEFQKEEATEEKIISCAAGVGSC